jgi:hypothetical protein
MCGASAFAGDFPLLGWIHGGEPSLAGTRLSFLTRHIPSLLHSDKSDSHFLPEVIVFSTTIFCLIMELTRLLHNSPKVENQTTTG